MTPEDIFISTQTALAELALSGCTTASDHLYLFPNGSRLDDEIEAARQVGLRLHASRGSMSLGESQGGLPPDSVVDTEDHILADSVRLIEQYHDGKPGSMLQIVLAPCSPFSVTGELMRQSARLARQYGVQLHTHLAETQDEEVFCLEKFGHRPVGYMQEVEWVGADVWFAHAVYVNPQRSHCIQPAWLRGGALPLLEYAPGLRDCAGSRIPAQQGEGWAGGGWFCQQRQLAYAGRSAPGDAAGAAAFQPGRRLAFHGIRRRDSARPGL